jgi:hypothetical protein
MRCTASSCWFYSGVCGADSCSKPTAGRATIYATTSFQPEAGKDYEVASIVNQQGCAVVVFEVQANGEIKPITR